MRFTPFPDLRRFLPAAAALLILTGCGGSPVPEPAVTLDQLAKLTYGPPVEQFEESAGVRFALSAARLDAEWAVLRGAYVPAEAGFHLYSKDMPMEGIDGTGRPTRLEVLEGASQTGTVLSDREPHDLKQFDQVLPVYPEGPVTLYRLVRAPTGATVTAEITYMSCSAETCNAPVERHPMQIAIP